MPVCTRLWPVLALLTPPAAVAFVAHRPPLTRSPPASCLVRAPGCHAREVPLLPDEEAYNAKLEEARSANKMVVIKFRASWCRACKAMAPKFSRIVDDPHWAGIEFHEILFDDNKKLFKSIGIKTLPYVEIVAGAQGKVQGFTCGPSKISKLVQALETASTSFATLGDREFIEPTDISALLPDD